MFNTSPITKVKTKKESAECLQLGDQKGKLMEEWEGGPRKLGGFPIKG